MSSQEAQTGDNVIDMFLLAQPRDVPPLTADEVLLLRQFLQEFAIIRATCPMAVRALSTRS